MTKDFKKAGTAASSSQYGISWVLGGIAVGLMAGAIVYALMGPNATLPGTGATTPTLTGTPAGQTPAVGNPAQTPATASLQDKPTSGDNRPGFSYHAVLPQLEMSVPISVQEENPNPEPTPPAATATATPPAAATEQAGAQAVEPETTETQGDILAAGRYMFQLGAYKTEAQATQMQKLASKSGLNTRVESAEIKGERWYRVRLGPSDDLNTVNRWKQMLSGMGISAMVIRL